MHRFEKVQKCFFFQLVLEPPFFKRKNQRAAFEDDACIVNSGTQNAGVRGGVGGGLPLMDRNPIRAGGSW